MSMFLCTACVVADNGNGGDLNSQAVCLRGLGEGAERVRVVVDDVVVDDVVDVVVAENVVVDVNFVAVGESDRKGGMVFVGQVVFDIVDVIFDLVQLIVEVLEGLVVPFIDTRELAVTLQRAVTITAVRHVEGSGEFWQPGLIKDWAR